ncbi:MsnO8 family LLM class oxidoreductase [Enterococcus faecalis]|uniref:MsnO8 family LLM class oxidoreductase n=1 Tax=Enterococcus faecalis TaxID=1351 RepID=UPI003CC52014
MVEFSILDYAPIDASATAHTAIQQTVQLAQHAEKLGFKRFWVAEHHDVLAFASSTPELLMMHIADYTNHIRVGSGGVMLPHYSPYKVAENFRMLQAIHPHRVDLGVGNSVGTPQVNAALNEGRKKTGYPSGIHDLIHYLSPQASTQPFRYDDLTARPVVQSMPDIWMLSGSIQNALRAAELGVGYCYGLFPNIPGNRYRVGREALQVYHQAFQSNVSNAPARTMIALFAAIAESEEEAEDLGKALHLWLLGEENYAQFEALPTIEEARHYNLTLAQQTQIEKNRHRVIIASEATLRNQMDAIIHRFNPDEILLCLLVPTIEARLQSLEILSNVYQLIDQTK